MKQVIRLMTVVYLTIFLNAAAFANDARQDINSKAFVLRGPTKPTSVVTLNEATKQKFEFMRMPDLGGPDSSGYSEHTSDMGAEEINIHETSKGHQKFSNNSKSRGKESFISKQSASQSQLRGASGNSKSTLRPTAAAITDSQSSRALRFGMVKITGTLRLPRVKFARVGVAMDLRDEMPSLDFTQKSLKDSGF